MVDEVVLIYVLKTIIIVLSYAWSNSKPKALVTFKLGYLWLSRRYYFDVVIICNTNTQILLLRVQSWLYSLLC